MKILPAEYLRRVGIAIFSACGAPPEDAAIVSDELVEASLVGVDSHGVMRYAQYVEDVLEGKIRPGAQACVVKESETTAIVDCGFNFGPVSARRMVDIACAKAKQNGVVCVVSENSHHVGRLGAYAEKIAARDLFCVAAANSSKHGHFVVPWGGREGRLGTNPLAFAAPTSNGPIVLDMSTSMLPEGKIRILVQQGGHVPRGCIQDAQGNPTTDPTTFYGPPRGTILPFGGELGYRGFGLSLLVEILSGILAGQATSIENRYINGLCLIVISPHAFCGTERFKELMDDLVAYITTTAAAPGFAEVIMPGAPEHRMREQRLAEGIPVADETWRRIVEAAKRVGVIID